MAEVIECTQKESLLFENTGFHKPGLGDIQADSKDSLSSQKGTGTYAYKGLKDQCRTCFIRGNQKRWVSGTGTYAYKGPGNRCRTCFYCGEYGHFVACCPYSSGYTLTDAKAKAYSSTFPTRRGNQRSGMKLAMTATNTNYGLD